MRDHSLFFMDLHGNDPYFLPTHIDPLLSSNAFGVQLFSHIGSVFDNQFRYITVPPNLALRETFCRVSKLAAAFLFWFSSLKTNLPDSHFSKPTNSSSFRHIPSNYLHLVGFHSSSGSLHESFVPLLCRKFSTFSFKHLFRRAHNLQSVPLLSLAAALIPPFDLTSNMLAIPPEDADLQILGSMELKPCTVENQGCLGRSFPDSNWVRHIVEPRTGIEFPGTLNNLLGRENQSILSSEVLVGTGSRTMTIIKIKSLKVYAFGFYVHPYSVCQKLGPKYASIPVAELKENHDFYKDLLREDIGMTVRLVVNCNGMKINTVRDAFEKSLRARLLKTNPETDFKCISAFGSYFTKDIPLPAGTIIDFRRTADGRLITEIGGNQIGAVQSRELCRAFFDMYIGEIPVSEQTKEEIGKNVASIIRRC